MSIQNPEEILIRLLLRRHGIPACDYSGLRLLSEVIQRDYGQKVSLNTLARIAGLRSDTRTPFSHTMDILAKAANFPDFKQFEQFVKMKSNLRLTDNREILTPFIAGYTKEAIANNDLFFIKKFLSHIEKNGCPTDELYAVSYAIAEGLRINKNPGQVIKLLTNAPVSVDLFFETYVDGDHFLGYYGQSMVEIAGKTKEPDRLFLFSNAIALQYEKETGNATSYKKRGKKLAAIDHNIIEKMLEQKWVYPVARWFGSTSGFLYEQGDKKSGNLLIEKMLSYKNQLTPDEQMILLSEASPVAPYLEQSTFKELVGLFSKNKEKIVFEFDSLVNAGVNLMMCKKSNALLTLKQIENYMDKYPLQFSMNKTVLHNKALKLFK
jgi:hypothetical protein